MLAGLAAPALAGQTSIDIQTSSRDFARFGSATLPPSLSFLGGIVMKLEDENFGGFSGLDVSPDGKSFITVSDRGHWLRGNLIYRDGMLAGVGNVEMAPIRNTGGNVDERKSRSDAEAVAAWSAEGIGAKVVVGFERRERVEQFDLGRHGLDAPAEPVRLPRAAGEGESNGEIEALGRFNEGPLKGWLIAISERNETPAGELRGWLWRKGKTHEFHLARHEDYRVTGLAVLPGGEEIITVERSFTPPIRVGMAMRRFKVGDLERQKAGAGQLVFEGKIPAWRIDNMEGIAAHQDDRGTIITVISDDNFNRSIQDTVMFQFRLNLD